MRNMATHLLMGLVLFLVQTDLVWADSQPGDKTVEQIVTEVVKPLMQENDIPGLSVGLVFQGQQSVFNYGVASKSTGKPVTDDTLFEIGSISKVFTATLAGYALANKKMSLDDQVGLYWPELVGRPLGQVTLLQLGTYTAGGLPLQFPDSVQDQATLTTYYQNWQPSFAAGTQRLYSNPSLGLFGHLAAKSLGDSFINLMEKTLLSKLGLSHTHILVPQEQMDNYAWGYSKTNQPVRVTPGVFEAEAYGLKTTASDLLQFVAVNLNSGGLEDQLQQAIRATQTGYFEVGQMVQGLGWEMYPDSAGLDLLLAGNSPAMVLEPQKATTLNPPKPPQTNIWANKTGSTGGFGAYAVFIPAKKMGLVILANKNYPNLARIKAAHQILTALDVAGIKVK